MGKSANRRSSHSFSMNLATGSELSCPAAPAMRFVSVLAMRFRTQANTNVGALTLPVQSVFHNDEIERKFYVQVQRRSFHKP